VESGQRHVDGLGLLDADIVFEATKTLQHWDVPLRGYEIHHGQVARTADDPWLGVGIRRGAVYGTHWHGLFDNDDVRRRWLTDAAVAAGRQGFVVADDVNVAGRRDAQLEVMADLLAASLDVAAVLDLLEHGAPSRPVIASAITGR
jgi:adenosylcobyric acid synthase